mmetsp:Transcript_105706/g.305853  ORF Transcript_105706/g.305853 Transcript_105706/m.305853 type:complete len:276 (+) Transcript_105706:488-1315(+)
MAVHRLKRGIPGCDAHRRHEFLADGLYLQDIMRPANVIEQREIPIQILQHFLRLVDVPMHDLFEVLEHDKEHGSLLVLFSDAVRRVAQHGHDDVLRHHVPEDVEHPLADLAPLGVHAHLLPLALLHVELLGVGIASRSSQDNATPEGVPQLDVVIHFDGDEGLQGQDTQPNPQPRHVHQPGRRNDAGRDDDPRRAGQQRGRVFGLAIVRRPIRRSAALLKRGTQEARAEQLVQAKAQEVEVPPNDHKHVATQPRLSDRPQQRRYTQEVDEMLDRA